MRYCTECGKKITKEYKFCPDCGQSVVIEETNHNATILVNESTLTPLLSDEKIIENEISNKEHDTKSNNVIDKSIDINEENIEILNESSCESKEVDFELINKPVDNIEKRDKKDLVSVDNSNNQMNMCNSKIDIANIIDGEFRVIDTDHKKVKKIISVIGCVCMIGVLSVGCYKLFNKNDNIEIEESYAHLGNNNVSDDNGNENKNSDYIISKSSEQILGIDSLNKYSYKELYIARNEIVARHGYIFNDYPKLQKYFESKSWYKSDKSFNGKLEDDIEITNISAITSMEFLKMANEENNEINVDYVFSDSNKSELTNDDVKKLNDWELIIAKNEIYARYGFIFSTNELKEHFDRKQWYKENSDLNNNVTLNNIEYKNIDIIVCEQDKRISQRLNHDL